MWTKIKEYFLKNKLLVIAAAILLLIKLINLDQIYLLRGERDIAFTGYSLAKTARDLYGNFLPLEFRNLDMPTPLLAFYYSALWWILIPFKSVFFARLPYVLLSLSLLFLVYEVVLAMTKDKKIALLTSLIFSFSPGVFHLTRLSLEIGLAMPLLLFAILSYLKQKKLLSYVFFVLTFFSYNGFRPVVPFILIYLELYSLFIKKKPKEFFVESGKHTLFFIILFVFSFTFVDGHMTASRKKDLTFFSYEKIDPLVVFRRNTAIGPLILKQAFNNKITSTLYYQLEVFVKGQDLRYLFLKGDDAAIYATTFTGQFFLTGLIFYYLGFLFLGKKWDWKYFFILGIIPVSFISSLVNIDYVSVAIRSMPGSIGYAFIIACGLFLGWSLLVRLKKPFKLGLLGLLGTLFFIELAYFGYNYYFRRPVTMSESFFESEKQIGQYLLEHKNKYLIYDDSPRNIYATYLFLKPSADIPTAQKDFAKGEPYKFDGFTLKKCPSSPKELTFKQRTIIADSCTDIPLYESLNNNDKVKKIYFRDFSLRTAFFVID